MYLNMYCLCPYVCLSKTCVWLKIKTNYRTFTDTEKPTTHNIMTLQTTVTLRVSNQQFNYNFK